MHCPRVCDEYTALHIDFCYSTNELRHPCYEQLVAPFDMFHLVSETSSLSHFVNLTPV